MISNAEVNQIQVLERSENCKMQQSPSGCVGSVDRVTRRPWYRRTNIPIVLIRHHVKPICVPAVISGPWETQEPEK